MRIRFFSRSPSQMQSLSSPRCNERQLWKQTLHLLYLILHHKYVHSNASLLSSNSGPPFYLSCSRPSLRTFLTTTVFDCLSLIRFLQLPEFNLMTVLVDPMPNHFYPRSDERLRLWCICFFSSSITSQMDAGYDNQNQDMYYYYQDVCPPPCFVCS